MKAQKKVAQKSKSDEKVNPQWLRLTEDARRTRDTSALFSLEGLPHGTLEPIDVPRKLKVITQEELQAYATAEYNFRVAQADFERKHGNLVLRLILQCLPEPGPITAKLDREGRVLLKEIDRHSSMESHPLTLRTRS